MLVFFLVPRPINSLRSPMILSQILEIAQPENFEVFMEIHCCYWWVVAFLFPRAWPKNTEVTLWLDPRRGHRSAFPLDAHVAPAEAAGVCPVPVPPSFSFQFPPYTQSSDIHYLPHPIFNKQIIMFHIRHGYFTNNTFGKRALPILSVFTQG